MLFQSLSCGNKGTHYPNMLLSKYKVIFDVVDD